jgi:4-diphosphocytidyl-2-C-methyl-D-erythritol kinase
VTTLKAPAKLNLWLRITGIREDGYHELDSLFVPISIFDEIKVSKVDYSNPASNSKNGFVVSVGQTQSHDLVSYFDPSGIPLTFVGDTVSKALRILREAEPSLPFFEIKITKRIPILAGLGGSSSDPGTLLKYLRDQYIPKMPDKELLKIAAKVGADVPFFLGAKPALVTGIGDHLQPVTVEKVYFVICRLPFGVSSKDVYEWFDRETQLTRGAANATPKVNTEVSKRVDTLLDAGFTTTEIVENMVNDLENPVVARHKEITQVKEALRTRGALNSLMSGSGSSVYGVFKSFDDAELARLKLKQALPTSYDFFTCENI